MAKLLALAPAVFVLAAPCRAGETACLTSTVVFETSALERLVRDPGEVLANEESFWESEKAQVYTSMWSSNTGIVISRERWRRAVTDFAKLTPVERAESPLVTMTEAIVEAKGTFLAGAIPHLCSFFPADVPLDVPVCFTAFIPPRAFATGGIVINVTAGYWKGNPDNILNALVHELFHVGYSQMRGRRSEAPHASPQVYQMLDDLQNEGMATYVGYRARTAFPAPDEIDYRLLDDEHDVLRLFGEVNTLFGTVGKVSPGKVRKLAWKTGVTRRGYYVVGAAMARTIDSRLGRDTLVETLAHGPLAFVASYNSLVDMAQRVAVPDGQIIAAREAAARLRLRLVWAAASVLLIAVLGAGLALMRSRRRR